MCFSAGMSFGTSGLLFLLGAGSLSKVSRTSQVMLATTPIIFSIQQFSEGVLWTCISKADSLLCQQISTYIFVTFGQIVWPLWIPLSLFMIEPDRIRKKTLMVFVLVGLLISSFLAYRTLTYEITSTIKDHHIYYSFGFPPSILDSLTILYIVPTVISHFFSSFKKVHILGMLYLMAFLITKFFFKHYVFSTWCFFAAIISAYIFHIIQSNRVVMDFEEETPVVPG